MYRKKLTRSLSFFTINKSCENLFNTKTLKRSLSLQNICQLSDDSAIAEHFKNFICENSAETSFPPDHSEPEKSECIFLSKEINSKTMETVYQLPVVNIPTPVENATLHSGSSEENNAILPAENTVTGLKQLICTADQPMKDIESVNVLLDSEAAKENNGVLDVDNTDLSSETGMQKNSMLHHKNADSKTTKDTNGGLADNADLHSVAIKESNSMLFAKNASKESNIIPDQLIKHVTESTSADNAVLHSKTTKENNGMLPVDCVDLHSETTKESNGMMSAVITATVPFSKNPCCETAKTLITDSVNVDNCINSSVVKIAESHVIVSNENYKPNKNVNEIAAIENEKTVLDGTNSFIMKETVPSNYSTNISNTDVVKCYPEKDTEVSIPVKSFVSDKNIAFKSTAVSSIKKSNDMNLPELSSSKSSAVDIPAKELFLPKKTETIPPVKNSDADMENNEKCDDKICDPSKSSRIDETSVSKKRKLESRNKRSKKHKSEEKQGNLKIRSIKKVGEICYTAEEVKTMLDIMKHLL